MKRMKGLLVLAAILVVSVFLFVARYQQIRASDKIHPPITMLGATARIVPKPIPSKNKKYEVRYERYGVLGLYHISLRVNVIKDGVTIQKLHIDGCGRFPQCEFNLGLGKIMFRIPPAYLAGSVNPRGYKKHFLGLLTSSEFGPTYTLDDEKGTMLVSMAHHAITSLDNNAELLYCTFPFRIGNMQFWTSNSVVASLVKAVNDKGIKLPGPVGGSYPGLDGPFLPNALFEYDFAPAH